MSIQFNPNQPADQNPPAAPKKGWLERYAELADKMRAKDAQTPLEYCTRKWTRKTGAPPTEADKASDAFERCLDGHRAHLRLSEWLNRY